MVALSLAYYGAGKVAWLLGTPGQAVALWPAAGIALGVMLLRGVSLWPAAFVGAFALALEAAVPAGLGWQRAGLVAAGVATGSVLETVFAALLIRRFVGSRSLLKDSYDVSRFAFLAGPGPALLGAGVATCVLFWGGLVDFEDLIPSALIWWLGDLLGLLVFGPLVLLVGSRRRAVPWSRKLAVALPVLAATGLVLWVFVRASRWDQRRADAVVQQRVDSVVTAVHRALVFHLDALRSLADFVGAGGKVDAPTFQRLAGGAVVRHYAFEALAWAPAPLDNKPVPITQVEPRLKHQALVGVDLAAEPDRREKLINVRQTGEPLALDVAVAPEARALWLFIPAPGRSGEGGVEGYLGAVMRLDVLVDRAITGFAVGGIGIELREGSARGKVVHRAPASLPVGSDLPPRPESRLVIADRTFSLVPVVSRTALATLRSPEVWVVLVAGMLFVMLLEGVMLVASGRSRRGRFAVEASVNEADDVGAYIDEDTTQVSQA